jgi:putative methionine-R-sulfoxide reductase with GAF domain
METWMTDHQSIVEQAASLLAGQDDLIANAANLSSLLFYSLTEVNIAAVFVNSPG